MMHLERMGETMRCDAAHSTDPCDAGRTAGRGLDRPASLLLAHRGALALVEDALADAERDAGVRFQGVGDKSALGEREGSPVALTSSCRPPKWMLARSKHATATSATTSRATIQITPRSA